MVDSCDTFIDKIYEKHKGDPEEMQRSESLKNLMSKWKNISKDYLDKKTDSLDSEILEFQSKCDLFCDHFLELNDAREITNYLNDLFSGVVTEYMFIYRNLAALSNVGPEALVGSTRSICERRCNGGHTGVNGKGSVVSTLENWSLRKVVRLVDFFGFKNQINGEDHMLEDRFIKERVAEYNIAQKPAQAVYRAKRKKAKTLADEVAADVVQEEVELQPREEENQLVVQEPRASDEMIGNHVLHGSISVSEQKRKRINAIRSARYRAKKKEKKLTEAALTEERRQPGAAGAGGRGVGARARVWVVEEAAAPPTISILGGGSRSSYEINEEDSASIRIDLVV